MFVILMPTDYHEIFLLKKTEVVMGALWCHSAPITTDREPKGFLFKTNVRAYGWRVVQGGAIQR